MTPEAKPGRIITRDGGSMTFREARSTPSEEIPMTRTDEWPEIPGAAEARAQERAQERADKASNDALDELLNASTEEEREMLRLADEATARWARANASPDAVLRDLESRSAPKGSYEWRLHELERMGIRPSYPGQDGRQ